jgi:alpha-D-xyloside xylohydrolase
MQRYGAAAWSGDINGNWETFKRQIPAGLNFSLTGIPYWTTDTGGFFHPGDQYTSAYYNELLARWFQWSTFCPILRIHGYQTETEMWKWLPETQKILLAYDELRYRMLPYNFSVAWKVTHEGYTFMRALPMDFRADARVAGISDQFMFGPAFLVHPVTRAMDNVQVPPPATIPAEFLHTPEGQPGIAVQYFEGTNFEKPAGKSIDPKVEYTWPGPPQANPPGGLTGFNNFSARWEGTLTAPEEGEYEIGLEGDDGFRLWLDGKLVVEDWAARPALYKGTKIALRKGQVLPLKIEYYQGGGNRILRLNWRTPSQLKEFLGTKAGLKHAMATYLPAGANWYDFWTNEHFTGGRTVSKNCPLDTLPLYVRAGSIVPLGPVQQYANEKPADPIELRVYRGANGALDLYEDEGDNYNYESGTYATIPLRWDEKTQRLTLGARKGRFPGMLAQRTFHVVWVGRNHGAGIAAEANPDTIVHYSGKTTIVKPARPF